MIDFEDDRYLDILQNMEFSVVAVYRADPELLDSEGDVLYISVGEPRPAASIDLGESILVRYDESS